MFKKTFIIISTINLFKKIRIIIIRYLIKTFNKIIINDEIIIFA